MVNIYGWLFPRLRYVCENTGRRNMLSGHTRTRSYLHVREDPAIMYEIFRGLKAYDFDARLSCLFTEEVDRSSCKDGDSAEQMARY